MANDEIDATLATTLGMDSNVRDDDFFDRLRNLGTDGMQRFMDTMVTHENAYLRKNVEHLRRAKHSLEDQVSSFETRSKNVEQQMQQYKTLYEQSKTERMQEIVAGGGNGMEIHNLHQQLSAVQMLKDVLNMENVELQEKLSKAQRSEGEDMKHAACVICLDNLANLVCIPCKHLALCSYCAAQDGVDSCPICRTEIREKMQIYLP